MLRALPFLSLALLLVNSPTAIGGDQATPSSTSPINGMQVLQHEVGTWDCISKTWTSPDAEPTTSKGVETNRMLGEFWVVGVYESELFGQPFRGQSQVGYDPVAKKFVGTWIDTMSPNLNQLQGAMDGERLVRLSESVDPKTGNKVKTKMVSTYPDPMHKTFVSYEPVPNKPGEWRKTMEVTYTKRPE